MTVCATCSRELQPTWKYCIYCGTRTSVPLTAAIDIISADELAGASPEPPSVAPSPVYDNTDTGVLKIEDIPSDEVEAAAAAAPAKSEPKMNVLAVIALILGCLASPLAALFGHIALSQIGKSGGRGTAIAWVAVVLGYLSLAAWLVVGISYLVLNS
jgi:hypothetical protein